MSVSGTGDRVSEKRKCAIGRNQLSAVGSISSCDGFKLRSGFDLVPEPFQFIDQL